MVEAIRLLRGELLLDIWVKEAPLSEHTRLRVTAAGRVRQGWQILTWGGEYLVGFDEHLGDLIGFYTTNGPQPPWLKHFFLAQLACHNALASERPFDPS